MKSKQDVKTVRTPRRDFSIYRPVHFINETTWRKADLIKIFEESRRLHMVTENSSVEWRNQRVPDRVTFVSAGLQGQYTVIHSTSSEWQYNENETERWTIKRSDWRLALPVNNIDPLAMLRAFDKQFGVEVDVDNLRSIVQRLRALIGNTGRVEFIVQHRNRKKRVYHGRRVRAQDS